MNTQIKLKFLLFGATRNTGFYFMQQALDAGHEVTAVIRNPDLFSYQHPQLKVVKGDALQLHTFESEVAGKDAVISSLGVTEALKPTSLCSEGVKNMLEAMQKSGVARIMCVSASAVELNPKMGLFIRTASRFLQWLLKYSYSDLLLMEQALKNSHASWTVVRPPQLKNMPVTGKYRIAIGENLKNGFSIGRPDLAHFVLNHVLDTNTYGKIVEIAY